MQILKLCRSCNTPFHGKYLQQCSFCGHPAHEDNFCGVGVIRFIPTMTEHGRVSVGCLCKEERYE